MDIGKQQNDSPSKAEVKAKALEAGQAAALAAAGPALAQYSKYIGMYNQMVSVYDKVQKFRKAPRDAVLGHSLIDTIQAKKSAAMVALEKATQIDKKMAIKLGREFASKVTKVL